jgi:tetratricopeptide (TPR) repeat protein
MADLPPFDTEALRHLAGDAAFKRGTAYHAEGRVTILDRGGQRVVARVAGSEDYSVTLSGGGSGIDGACSCPAFEDRAFCKHLVAVALAVNVAGGGKDADEAARSDRLRRYLAGKSVDALVTMLLEIAARDAVLFERLDVAAAMALDDDETLRRRLVAAIDRATATRTHIGYREAPAWAEGVAEVLDRIGALVGDGRAGAALGAVEHALAAIAVAIQSIDDSDGHGGALLAQARDIHLAACRVLRPEPAVLARGLFERAMKDDYDVFSDAPLLYAEVLGERGLAELQRLAAEAWAKLPPRRRGRGARDDFLSERWRLSAILDFFAKRANDLDARIAIRARDLASPWDYVELARLCLSEGREAEALRWAEEGLWQFEDEEPDERLIRFAADLLVKAGRATDAEAVVRRAFERAPTFGLYEDLRRCGGKAAGGRAIGFLRERLGKGKPAGRGYSPADLLVRILMDETMFDEAWAVVRDHGASAGLQASLAEASEKSHPREALAVHLARIDRLVSAGGNPGYAEAIELVGRAARLQSPAAQAALVAGLRTRFKAKRNFIKLLGA